MRRVRRQNVIKNLIRQMDLFNMRLILLKLILEAKLALNKSKWKELENVNTVKRLVPFPSALLWVDVLSGVAHVSIRELRIVGNRHMLARGFWIGRRLPSRAMEHWSTDGNIINSSYNRIIASLQGR